MTKYLAARDMVWQNNWQSKWQNKWQSEWLREEWYGKINGKINSCDRIAEGLWPEPTSDVQTLCSALPYAAALRPFSPAAEITHQK
jgi:hypothetical protein